MARSAAAPAGQELMLSNLSPGPAQKRLALGIVLVQVVGLIIMAGPLSTVPLRRIDAFVPAYGTAMFVNDSITAVLLFAQFSILRSRALLALANGYLLTALVAVPWTLTFPGVFAPDGFLGAGLQSTVWLYILWHAGFALSVIAYSLLKAADAAERLPPASVRSAILTSIAVIAAVVCGATVLVTAGDVFMPHLMLDPVRISNLWFFVAGPTAALLVVALVSLWLRHRSVLDLWLMVVLCAYAIEILLISFPVPIRFSLGWYAGRVYGLLSSSLLLLILLNEMTTLYGQRAAKLRRLVDANIIGTIIWDLEGRILEANDAFLRLVGHDRDDLISGRLRLTDLTPAQWRDRTARAHAELKTTGTFQPYEKEYLRKDGSRVPVLIGAATFEEGGKEAVSFVLDMTERKGVERALREREAKIRALFDANIIAIFIGDIEGRVLEANDAFFHMLGYDRDDLASGHVHRTRMSPPEWRERDARTRAELETLGRIQPFEKEYWRKDGSRVPVLIGAAVFQPDRVVAFVLDISERKRAEKALRESEEQWKAVFENNPTMYFMVDAGGAIVMVNPLGAEQLGFTVDELIGRPVLNLFHAEDREAVERNAAICFEQPGQAMSWEARKVRKSGEVLWVRETARVMPIRDRPAALIVCEDITERRRVSDALREMQAELAHANRVATMGQLTASIAHEVNQPIAAARNNAASALRFLSRNPPDLEEVRAALDSVVNDADRAGQIVDRIRAHVKKAPPRNDSFDINEAINELITLTRGEVAAKA